MMLGEIRDYLRRREIIGLQEITNHFDISPEAAKFALEYWVNKGKVNTIGAACGSSCGGCGSAEDSYQWSDRGQVVQLYRRG
ncbi:MAG TPA: hypothetical protein EYG68_02425 [Leucothrix mucor]|nr:hypothetical protein [Leucothrix mucor]